MAFLYGAQDSFNAGTAKPDATGRVSYRQVISGENRQRFMQVGAAIGFINFIFLTWLINPHHLFSHSTFIASSLAFVCFILFAAAELIRLTQSAWLWFFAYSAVNPIPQVPPAGGRIALITEINTGRETSEYFTARLQALKSQTYQGTVDLWVLDEDDDPFVKRIASSLNVKYFSRKTIPQLNTDGGEFSADSAYGNANAWRALHETDYDIVANINADDFVSPHFLERTLGYFLDNDVAFVTIPQVYGNQDSWLTRASGSQKFIFNAIMQRGANKFGSPILSGASQLYRAVAWQQIGGYQSGELSDHLTGMTVHGTRNSYTNNTWKGVFTPDILAIGQGPESWQDYFDVQRAWSHGIWQLLLRHTWRLDKRLRPGQSMYYAAMQYFIPGLSAIWLIGNVTSVLFFIFGLTVMNVSDTAWFIYWAFSITSEVLLFQWLNRYNLSDYERDQGGLDAIMLTLLSIPVYVSSMARAIAGKPMEYSEPSQQKDAVLHAFRLHLGWGLVISGVLVFGLINTGKLTGMVLWSLFALSITLLPIGIIRFRNRQIRGNELHQLHTSNS